MHNDSWSIQSKGVLIVPRLKTALTLWSDYSRPPEVDGQPVNYAPAQGYESPFRTGDFGGHTVTIGKGGRKLALDFEAASSRP